MKIAKGLLIASIVFGGASVAFAQSPPAPGDANPPGALKRGGIPPAAAARRGDTPPTVLRRGDEMAPLVQRDVSGRPQGFGNNPTPTKNDPRGTRTQCRGGC